MGSESITVLVVEDEALVRMDIAEYLIDAGFTVLEAEDADQAIDILNARTDIQLLFTDIDMPGSMDGLKLAAFVRDRWPPVKIIVTSGNREAPDLPGDTPFFAKPYLPSKIAEAIRRLRAAS
jgi:CheY-like chemotaxis protein